MNARPGAPAGLPETLEHFIAGQPAASADGGTFEVADPVSNQPYATVAAGGAKDVDRAVTAASTAFADGPWPDLPARARAMILNRIADGIEARAARIAELETFDTGLPITQARGQAARAVRNVNVALLQKHEQTVPDIVRAAYVELVVTDLDEARRFWVDLLGFVVTSQSEDALYLRGYDELIHHNLILTAGAAPAAARLAFRVRTAADLDLAETFFAALGARTARVPAGVTPGVGEAVRAEDPLGFTVEFFFDAEYTERLQQRYDLRRGAEPAAGGKATRRGHRGRGRLYPVTPAAS